jgi:hypothetical protein
VVCAGKVSNEGDSSELFDANEDDTSVRFDNDNSNDFKLVMRVMSLLVLVVISTWSLDIELKYLNVVYLSVKGLLFDSDCEEDIPSNTGVIENVESDIIEYGSVDKPLLIMLCIVVDGDISE